eukprot:TRINITY_DN39851_c0_g1_i1.p1 TRINITY_DN39851_c0_g1~~TRINITY_DN39851_c0_g1_i1.p1  ORF type:complete len:314 (+),score=83.97 TRINITY_DN39851_c0_g1_i1:55-942(+)
MLASPPRSAPVSIVDTDGDTATFVVDRDELRIRVVSSDGRPVRDTAVSALRFEVATGALMAEYTNPAPSGEAGWRMTVRQPSEAEDSLAAVREVFRVAEACGAACVWLSAPASASGSPPPPRSGVDGLCSEFAALISTEALDPGLDAAVEARGSALIADVRRSRTQADAFCSALTTIQEDTLPTVMSSATKLEAYFQQVDTLEGMIAELSQRVQELEKATAAEAAEPSLARAAKALPGAVLGSLTRRLGGGRPEVARAHQPTPLLIGGCHPHQWEERLQETLKPFESLCHPMISG